ncbi:MAG: phenylalanine--tRNA ligase subunit alpha [Candidatus Micrarchaeota archaeon]
MKENDLLVLKALSSNKVLESKELAKATGLQHASVGSVIESLRGEGFVLIEKQKQVKLILAKEGLAYLEKGTPEKRLHDALQGKSMSLQSALDKAGLNAFEKGIALQWIVRSKMAVIEKSGVENKLVPNKVESEYDELLSRLKNGEDIGSKSKLLVSRKLVSEQEDSELFVSITPEGVKASKQDFILVSQLTPELLRTGKWREKEFASYDVNTLVKEVDFGRKHPYKRFIRGIKDKLVGLGFKEVHGHFVELEFWNMDALFMAQDHPAREIHDVFMIDDVSKGEVLDQDLLKRVKKAHEEGLDESVGWGYKWDPEIALRLVLRSQTTALSARELSKGLKPPAKLFSIGRVFRPDEIDWKHFIEFNQCEGIVVDENVSLRDLLGYLKEFASEVFGAKQVRFVPTYFPFTEPSVEIHAKIEGKGWVEVGGAGLFRPEMLAALNVKTPVLAWGLGLDRLAMNALGITDIRDLFTHKLELLRKP